MIIRDIKINGISEPMGFSLDTPVLSFKVDKTKSKKASKTEISVWEDLSAKEDSSAGTASVKKVFEKSGKTLQQKGTALEFELKPRTRYICKVAVTGEQGDSAFGETFFETGKMEESWKADWIAAAEGDNSHPILRKCFRLKDTPVKARLYATGVGMFEASMNGEKLGDEVLAPFNNHYETAIQVLTFDISNLVKGDNTWEFLLGKGWYMGQFGLEMQEHNYGSRMAAIGELYVTYKDGSTEQILTDDTFTWKPSDILESGIYFGETLDRTAQKKKDDWKKVCVLKNPEKKKETRLLSKKHLKDRISPRLRAQEDVPVKEILHTNAKETVLDMGQNFAGFMQFHANFKKGTKITLDFGEVLQDGNFYRGNYREANSQYIYVSDGNEETVTPHFTYFGFRYVKVTGWPCEIQKEDFMGKAVYSELEQTGFLHTGNAKIDQLISNTIWGLKSNFMDLPTDCPQRNERLGWTGDAQVFSNTACYHMDTRAFYHKFLKDLRSEQVILDGGVPNYIPNIGHKNDCTAVWGDVATFVPSTIYKMFGNLEEASANYELMKDWVNWIDRKDSEREVKKNLYDFGFQFGDWLALDGFTEQSLKGSTEDAYIGSMYYCQSAKLVYEMAKRLGNKQDEIHYKNLYRMIRDAILAEYFTDNGRLAVDTQASYVIALKFGIYKNKERVLQQFTHRLQMDGYKIRCGFVGAPLLCTVLAENGLYETAYDFLLNESFPGWLYCVNLGATTVWERWNSLLPDGTISGTGMNSLNHYSYGSVMEFLYAYAAGIRPLDPGFTKAVIAPNPDVRLPKMECTFDSVSGRYICNTEIHTSGKVTVEIEIPFGAEADVTLPRSAEKTMHLTAGSYRFAYTPLQDYRKPYDESTTLSQIVKNENALGIVAKHAPALAGMAKGGDPEFVYIPLTALKHIGFIPVDAASIDVIIKELKKLKVS